MKALSIENLFLSYGKNQVLKDINLEIEDKHFLGIIGPNGGGKTSLLKVISGLSEYDQGSVKIYGKNIKECDGYIGYVPQASEFDKSFPINVLDVILLGSLKAKFKLFENFSDRSVQNAEKIMRDLNIYNLKNRQIGQLSGGQLQKVLIARALMTDPKILLLDEPTASIDTSSTTHIYDLLSNLNDKITIIVVTHNLEAVSSYFDSIACLNKKLYHHNEKKIDSDTIKEVYGCPVDLIAHGMPHRVLAKHGGDKR